MPKKTDPSPKENILTSSPTSKMQFMKECLVHDSEREALVRFRGPIIQPNWNGVESNETEYVVQESWTALYHIANEMYGNPELDWVIALRNGLDLPDVQIHKGKRLKVPNRDWVENVLLPQGAVLRSLG